MPLRVMVFPERPDVLLYYVPDGESIVLSGSSGDYEMTPPFTREKVAAAFRELGVDARVVEGTPGRWTSSMARARQDERSERGAAQVQRERMTASALSGSTSPEVRAYAEALTRKAEVDRDIR